MSFGEESTSSPAKISTSAQRQPSPRPLIWLAFISIGLATTIFGLALAHISLGFILLVPIASGLTVPFHLTLIISSYTTRGVSPFTIFNILYTHFLVLLWLAALVVGGILANLSRITVILATVLSGLEWVIVVCSVIICTRKRASQRSGIGAGKSLHISLDEELQMVERCNVSLVSLQSQTAKEE